MKKRDKKMKKKFKKNKGKKMCEKSLRKKQKFWKNEELRSQKKSQKNKTGEFIQISTYLPTEFIDDALGRLANVKKTFS